MEVEAEHPNTSSEQVNKKKNLLGVSQAGGEGMRPPEQVQPHTW